MSKSNAQWNGVPRGSAVSVRPPPGPLLLCDARLLVLHEEHPRRLPSWLETRCNHCQLLLVGYFKVSPVDFEEAQNLIKCNLIQPANSLRTYKTVYVSVSVLVFVDTLVGWIRTRRTYRSSLLS